MTARGLHATIGANASNTATSEPAKYMTYITRRPRCFAIGTNNKRTERQLAHTRLTRKQRANETTDIEHVGGDRFEALDQTLLLIGRQRLSACLANRQPAVRAHTQYESITIYHHHHAHTHAH